MNTKILIIVVALIILLGGLFFFLNLNQEEQQIVEENNQQKSEFKPENTPPQEKEIANIPLPPKPEVAYSNDFNSLMSQLETSEDIVRLVNNQIKYTPKTGNQAISAEELFSKKSGGQQDLAAFTAYALHINGFISFSFVYEDQNNNRYYTVAFRDTDLPKYIYFNTSGAHAVHHGWSFGELIAKEKERLGIEILRYGTVSPTSIELIPNEWVNY